MKNLYSKLQSNKGFTLIEVSIILSVFGILVTTFLLVMGSRIQQDRINAHFNNVSEISMRLADYALVNGAYPLPADPRLNPTDANFGVPVELANLPALTVSECDGTMQAPNNIICTVGSRTGNTIAAGDVVLMGAIPTSLLGYNSEESNDIHGSVYTYAVTRALTDEATFSNDGGLIRVLSDETGTDAVGTNRDVHFMVISHGQNKSSPFDPSTGITLKTEPCNVAFGRTCTPQELVTYATGRLTLEEENGQSPADATFMALTNPSIGATPTPNSSIFNGIREIAGSTYFDDALSFETNIYGREWTARGNDQVNLTMTLEGKAEGSGNVIIGANNYENFNTGLHPWFVSPEQYDTYFNSKIEPARPQVWVAGSIKADAALSERICESVQQNCFETLDIVSPDFDEDNSMRCVSRGLKKVDIYGGNNIGNAKDGSDSELQGECEVQTRVTLANNNVPDAAVAPCLNGSNGFDSSGAMICK